MQSWAPRQPTRIPPHVRCVLCASAPLRLLLGHGGRNIPVTAIVAAQLLDAAVAARCERLRLGGRRRHTERRAGEHLSGRGGQSIEFADFRDYHEGDDIRRVDWNSFARLRRPYVKVFRHEEEQHLAIIIDASASMAGGGKLPRACQLAAAFALVALTGGERVAMHIAGAEDRHLAGVRGRGACPPRRLRRSRRPLQVLLLQLPAQHTAAVPGQGLLFLLVFPPLLHCR